MGALQVLVFVASAVLVLENGSWMVEGAPSATYSYTTHHRASSSANAVAPTASNPSQQRAVSHHRGELSVTDYRKYLPVEDTPEVKKAREQFFTLYKKQAKLAADAKDFDLDGTYTHTLAGTRTSNDVTTDDGDYHYYYDYEGEDDESEYEDDEEEEEDEDEEEEDEDEEESEEEDDDDDEEGEEDSDEEDEEDSDEDEEDSSSSSSSSEEDYDGIDSSEEDGEDSSSSSEEDGEGSSSSSSSSSEEDDGEAGRLNTYALTSRGRYQPLSTNLLQAPKPVTETPEVKEAKRKFFELYKTQAELSFNAPDDK